MADYIRREDYCEENCGKENREGYKTCRNCGMLNVPSADVQPVKHGRWELTNNPSFRKCSECGAWWSSDITDNCFTNYCPKCGARMDGDAK